MLNIIARSLKPRKRIRYQLNTKLCEFQSRSGIMEKIKILCPPRIRTSDRPTRPNFHTDYPTYVPQWLLDTPRIFLRRLKSSTISELLRTCCAQCPLAYCTREKGKWNRWKPCAIKTNLVHYLPSVYFVNQPLHVSGIFVVHHQEVYCVYIYGKTVPLQARSGPEGSRKLRFPDFMTTVVSLTHRPPLPPGNAHGTHFC